MTELADRCSTLARALAEPLPGTAPLATTWIALEQEGPWGHKALTESHLDPTVGAELTARADGTGGAAGPGVTVVLIRRVGHHADPASENLPSRPPGPGPAQPLARSVWIAYTGPQPWLAHASISDPAVLLDLDFGALAAGVQPDLGQPDDERLLLVCTNSRRDECCALIGRPVAVTLAAANPGRVWESSHLGGHRLAPVVLSLPDGFVYGGPHAGALTLSACRGRSSLSRPAQAAELAALAASADPRPRPLTVTAAGDDWRVTDGEAGDGAGSALYRVDAVPNDPPRKESCKKGPVLSVAHLAARVDL